MGMKEKRERKRKKEFEEKPSHFFQRG